MAGLFFDDVAPELKAPKLELQEADDALFGQIHSAGASAAVSSGDAAVGKVVTATAAELAVPNLTSLTVRDRANSEKKSRDAEQMIRDHAVCSLCRNAAGQAQATVRGSAGSTYSVTLLRADADHPEIRCTCPDFAQRGGLCKHGVALLLVLLPGSGYVVPSSGHEDPASAPASFRVKEEEIRVKEECPGIPRAELMAKKEEGAIGAPPLPPPADAPPSWLSEPQAHAVRRPLEELLEPSQAATSSQPAKRRKLPASFFASAAAPGGDGACDAEGSAPPPKRAKHSPKRKNAADGTAGAARPTSAYQIYLRETKTFGAGETGVKWKDLSHEERRPYEDKAAEARLQWEADAHLRLPAASGMEERLVPARPVGLAMGQPHASASSEAAQAALPALSRQPFAELHSPSTWACPSCTYVNSSLLPSCEVCDAPCRSHAASAATTPSAAALSPVPAVLHRPPVGQAPAAASSSSAAASSSAPPPPPAAGKKPWLSKEGLSAQLDLLMFDDSQEVGLPAQAPAVHKPPIMSSTPVDLAPVRRTRCKYGEKCYQKNPKHRSDFCHPADEDWNDELNRHSRSAASADIMSVSAALGVAAALAPAAPSSREAAVLRPPMSAPSEAAQRSTLPAAVPMRQQMAPEQNFLRDLPQATAPVPNFPREARPAAEVQERRPASPVPAAPVPLAARMPLPVVPAAVRTPTLAVPAPAAPVEGYGRPVMSFFDRLKELDD